jgi:hypothetical protein
MEAWNGEQANRVKENNLGKDKLKPIAPVWAVIDLMVRPMAGFDIFEILPPARHQFAG